MNLCLIGTSGTIPLPQRHLSSMVLKHEQHLILFDCGEGTQVALSKNHINLADISVVCLTHLHADHVLGFPGLIATMSNLDRTKPLTVIGPPGTRKLLNSLCAALVTIPFKIVYYEMAEPSAEFNFGNYKLTAFQLDHSIVCYGYVFESIRPCYFDTEKVDGVLPKVFWSPLQDGQMIKTENGIYTRNSLFGEDRSGIKITYATDSRPTNSIIEFGRGSDLMILEGMYPDNSYINLATENKHMLFTEAAQCAKDAEVSDVWLTHYSRVVSQPEEHLARAREIFPYVSAGYDGKSVCYSNERRKTSVIKVYAKQLTDSVWNGTEGILVDEYLRESEYLKLAQTNGNVYRGIVTACEPTRGSKFRAYLKDITKLQ